MDRDNPASERDETAGASEPPVVYVVTGGQLSDYGIEAIFSDREDAARYVAAAKRGAVGYDHRIEEWYLNAPGQPRSFVAHEASIRLADGSLTHYPPEEERDVPGRRCEYLDADSPGSPLASISVTSPISAEHAAKVAVEKRQEWLREQATGEGGD